MFVPILVQIGPLVQSLKVTQNTHTHTHTHINTQHTHKHTTLTHTHINTQHTKRCSHKSIFFSQRMEYRLKININ